MYIEIDTYVHESSPYNYEVIQIRTGKFDSSIEAGREGGRERETETGRENQTNIYEIRLLTFYF